MTTSRLDYIFFQSKKQLNFYKIIIFIINRKKLINQPLGSISHSFLIALKRKKPAILFDYRLFKFFTFCDHFGNYARGIEFSCTSIHNCMNAHRNDDGDYVREYGYVNDDGGDDDDLHLH